MAIDVKTLCLGILNRGEATGYEIKKHCEEGPFGTFYAAGFGSIYPALNTLCAQGLATVTEMPGNGGPARKVYRITPAGRLALLDALAEPPAPDKIRSDFLFVLFFAHLLSARRVDALLAQRADDLDREIAEMRTVADTAGKPMDAGERFCLGFGLAVMEAERAYIEANRHVLVGALLTGGMAAER